MFPLISIIIPVYNVAPYIEKCLETVISQSYENLEIILVDDCGSDNSMDIVRDFCSSHIGNFVLLNHERNRGLSVARNTGVKHAKGDYLFFLDSDDELPKDAIRNFVQYLNKHGDADFLIGDYIIEGDFNYMPLMTPVVLEGKENIICSYLKGEWYIMACGKLISRCFFEEHNLWFVEGRLHEDDLFSFYLALGASKMITLQENVYKYIIRNGSITTAKKEKNYVDMFWIMSQKIEVVKQYDNKLEVCFYPYIVSNLFAYSILVSTSHLEYRKKYILLKWMKSKLKLLDKKNIPLKTLIEYCILSFPPCLVIGICRLINRFI